MRTRSELEIVKNFVDSTYTHFENKLIVDTNKVYDPEHTKLGFCFKHVDPVTGGVVYKIDCSRIGIERTDFRIMMHEYAHIYLGHLDNIHEEIDVQICNAFRDHRPEIIETIVKNCGIDETTANRLIERIIDDPQLNHKIHNIAMDMECNSSILSKEDVEEMELDISSVLPKYEEELLKKAINQAKSEDYKDALRDRLNQMESEAKIKLVIPERYYTGKNDQGEPIPFPNDLSYVDYIIMIIMHIDQFIKMMVSIQMGGNGDTKDVTKEDIQNALNGMFQKMRQRMSGNQQSDAFREGYKQALRDARQGKIDPSQMKQDPSQQLDGKSQEYKDGFKQGVEDTVNKNFGSSDFKQGYQDGQQSGQNQQGQGQQSQGQSQSQDYQDGFQAGQRDSQNGDQQEDYSKGYQDGKNTAQNTIDNAQNQGQGSGSGQQGTDSGQSQEMQDYNNGYQQALQDLANAQNQDQGQGLSDLLKDMGISSGGGMNQGQQAGGEGNQGTHTHDKKDPGQKKGEGREQDDTLSPFEGLPGSKENDLDHGSDSRKEADQKREAGQIQAGGGVGMGRGNGPDCVREVDKFADDVDMALTEVLNDVKSRVIKSNIQRDMMKLYNRGIVKSVIAPSLSRKVTISTKPKLVFLIDVSGSMDTRLIDRILCTISRTLKKINRDLRYDIITWSDYLGEHIKDIDPRKPCPKISCGGGTEMAKGMKYFKEHYGPEAILVLISDFCDSLDQWHEVEKTMGKYSIWGFNYGNNRYSYKRGDWEWTYFKQRDFSDYGYDD